MIFPRFRARAWRAYQGIETSHPVLRYLFFEVTRRCNLSCLHCGSDCGSEAGKGELTLESWLRLADYLKENFDPAPFIVITGGEPLVRDDIFELTAGLKSRGLEWGMVSNGLKLDGAALDRLIGNGLKSVTISLDGLERSHNALRRHPASFTKAAEALRLIGRSPIPTSDAVTCVHPGNISELPEIAELLLGLSIKRWRLFRIFPKGRAAGNEALDLDFAQSQALIRWIAEHRRSYRKKGLTISFSCEGYLPLDRDLQVRDEPYFCRAGINIASILADGTVTGCNNNGPQYHQGSVLETDFLAIWQHRFQEYRDRGWMRTGACAECREWKDCRGSSIHLKDKDGEGPGFCYLHDVS